MFKTAKNYNIFSEKSIIFACITRRKSLNCAGKNKGELEETKTGAGLVWHADGWLSNSFRRKMASLPEVLPPCLPARFDFAGQKGKRVV